MTQFLNYYWFNGLHKVILYINKQAVVVTQGLHYYWLIEIHELIL